MMNKECILEFREDCKYKGAFTALLDDDELLIAALMPKFLFDIRPKDFVVEVWGVIFTDENGIWRCTFRLKFPSGTKQVIRTEFGIDSNETKILQDIYSSLPMKEKCWVRNPKGTGNGLLEEMRKADMIESVQIMVDKHE